MRHSLSPLMYRLSFAHHGLNAIYLAFRVTPADLPDALRGLRALDVGGFNLTMPLKTEVTSLLDGLSPEAALTGAVNTVEKHGGQLVGHNTDSQGFACLLAEKNVDISGRRAVLCGTGGAGRAVAVALARAGAGEIVLCNRSPASAAALAGLLTEHFPSCAVTVSPLEALALATALSGAALFVNCTSVGMDAGASIDIPAACLSPELVVVDVVYGSGATALLKTARERGCRTLDGLDLLIHQGALAFRLWTGLDMPRDVVRAALRHGTPV